MDGDWGPGTSLGAGVSVPGRSLWVRTSERGQGFRKEISKSWSSEAERMAGDRQRGSHDQPSAGPSRRCPYIYAQRVRSQGFTAPSQISLGNSQIWSLLRRVGQEPRPSWPQRGVQNTEVGWGGNGSLHLDFPEISPAQNVLNSFSPPICFLLISEPSKLRLKLGGHHEPFLSLALKILFLCPF